MIVKENRNNIPPVVIIFKRDFTKDVFHDKFKSYYPFEPIRSAMKDETKMCHNPNIYEINIKYNQTKRTTSSPT